MVLWSLLAKMEGRGGHSVTSITGVESLGINSQRVSLTQHHNYKNLISIFTLHVEQNLSKIKIYRFHNNQRFSRALNRQKTINQLE